MVDVSNTLGPNWPSFLALLIVLFGIVWSEHRKRFREGRAPDLNTREGMLEEQVQKLQATVTTLLEDRTAAQKQIDALRRELDEANVKIAQLLAKLGMYEQPKAAEILPVRVTGEILVGVGTDPMLQADLAALRKVENRSGGAIKIIRLSPATLANLKRTLDRHRKGGKPIRWVHLSVHACEEGVALADDLVSGQWLSENMSGVETLVINGCESDVVADWVGLVPYVVSMREAIPNADAANFCEAFWQGIAEGLDVEAAFDRSLVRVPAVAEYAELHV